MTLKTDYTITIEGQPLFVREVLPRSRSAHNYLLFVHGNTFPSVPDFDLTIKGRSYAAFLAAHNICCCIFDSRGFGRSYKPHGSKLTGLSERAADLRAVFDHLRHARGATGISLFGLSTGCNVIAEFLAALPAQDAGIIEKIIFSGPCYLFNDKAMTVTRRLSLLRLLRRLTGRGDNPYFSFKKRHLQKRLLEGETAFIDKAACDAFIEDALSPSVLGRRLKSPVLSFPEQHRQYQPWQRLFDVRNLTYPLLILRGERDHYCCERTARSLLDEVPSRYVKLVTLPATNHDMHLYRDPQAVFEEVSRFMYAPQKGEHHAGY